MSFDIKKRALNSLAKISDWVEEQNTFGSGDRWSEKVIGDLEKIAVTKPVHTICKEPKLAKFQYRCFTYKDKWVVAYKINGNQFIVYRFIYGAWLHY